MVPRSGRTEGIQVELMLVQKISLVGCAFCFLTSKNAGSRRVLYKNNKCCNYASNVVFIQHLLFLYNKTAASISRIFYGIIKSCCCISRIFYGIIKSCCCISRIFSTTTFRAFFIVYQSIAYLSTNIITNKFKESNIIKQYI